MNWIAGQLSRIQGDTDRRLSAAYRPALIVLLVFACGLYIYRLHGFASIWQGWVVADWLINFGGGFVRRGVVGELILGLSSVTGIGANTIVMVLQSALYAGFCVAFIRLLRDRRIDFWFFFLCLSPLFVLFNVLDVLSIGRKELLLYVVFSGWIFTLRREDEVGQKQTLFFTLLLLCLAVAHEMVVFYSPWFVFAAFLRYGNFRKALDLCKIIPVVAVAALLILSLGSGAINQGAICQRILESGADPAICSGILAWPVQSVGDALWVTAQFSTEVTPWALGFTALSFFVPAMLFLLANARGLAARSAVLLILMLLFSLPLFLLAVDWGRWIHIHMTLAVLSFVLLLNRDSQPADASETPPADTAASWSLYAVSGLVLLATNLFWNIRHCCGPGFWNFESGGALYAIVSIYLGS